MAAMHRGGRVGTVRYKPLSERVGKEEVQAGETAAYLQCSWRAKVRLGDVCHSTPLPAMMGLKGKMGTRAGGI